MIFIKSIIEYFNNNAFVASIVTLFLSTIINILIIAFERKLNSKESIKERKRNEKINKAEFRIDRILKEKSNDIIKLIYTDYFKKKINDKEYDCYYNEKIIDEKKLKTIRFPLKNIGKTSVCELFIVCNNRNTTMIVEKDRINYLIKGKYPNYVVGYYKKILPGENIMIELNYYKDAKVFASFSSELSIYYRDDFSNFYYQPIFLDYEVKIEGPYSIKPDEYIKKTSLIV